MIGRNCFKSTLKRIIENPYMYLDGRIRAFLASHGKFSFDYVYPNPIGWKNHYQKINILYEKKKIKLIRQIIVFALMMYIYFTIFHFIFFKKDRSELRNGVFVSSIPYIYLVIVGTFAAGTEQERILYTGFVVNITYGYILVYFYLGFA